MLQTGIAFFCVVFAVNSAVHSYLVLRYAEGNKAAVTVGFYYCSNAAGRLFGTLLSGVLYTYAGSAVDGFGWCASSTLRSRGCACQKKHFLEGGKAATGAAPALSLTHSFFVWSHSWLAALSSAPPRIHIGSIECGKVTQNEVTTKGALRANYICRCFIASALALVACVALTKLIHDDADGLACGAFMLVKRPLPIPEPASEAPPQVATVRHEKSVCTCRMLL